MKKEFNSNFTKLIRECYALLYKQKQSYEELSDIIKEKIDIFEVLQITPLWSTYYELSYIKFIAVFIIEFEMSEIINEISIAEDKSKAIRDFTDNPPEIPVDDNISDNKKAFRFSLTIALIRQSTCIATYSESMSDLIEKVRNGNDEALFEAVLIDRSAISSPSIAHRIQIAQLMNDESFLNELTRSIRKTKPRPMPKEHLNDARYMIEIFDQEIGLENITVDSLYDLISDDLELYSNSIAGFEKLLQRRNERLKT